MNVIRTRLRDSRIAAEKKQDFGKVAQSTISDWENNPPKQLFRLRELALRYGTNADFLLGLTDDASPRHEENIPVYQRSILEIMRLLPEYKREEVIRIAEVVLAIHRKEEADEAEPSLFEKVKKNYEQGNAVHPRIIGEEDAEDETGEDDQESDQ